MDDLKTLLRDKAEEMRLDPQMPASLKGRTRRRRIGNAVISSVVVIGIGVAAFAGARELVEDGETPGPRPATPPPASGETLPIWPIGEAEDLDRIQLEVDRGHQPWYLSPKIVAQVFAMDVLLWDRRDIEASVRGDDPVTVFISNPTLAQESGVEADLRTVLSLERWRDRHDGIFVVTRADAEALDLHSPSPLQDLTGLSELPFTGTVSLLGQELVVDTNVVHLTLGHEDDPWRISPFGQATASPDAAGEFATTVPLASGGSIEPSWLGAMAFLSDGPMGRWLGVEAFRLGPAPPLPPAPADERLPDAVEATREAIQVAANDSDWDALAALIPADGFEYTFGASEGSPISYWRPLERKWVRGEEGGVPITLILSTLLSYPGTEYEGLYMWPSASVKDPKDWTEEDLQPLRRIYSEKELEQISQTDGYYGWRVGIEANGDWIFFVAGD